MSKINYQAISILGHKYSATASLYHTAGLQRERLKDALDQELRPLQSAFRRKLAASLRGTGAVVLRSRVYACFNHSSNTSYPNATATIQVKKGFEISLNFAAGELSLADEIARLRQAVVHYLADPAVKCPKPL